MGRIVKENYRIFHVTTEEAESYVRKSYNITKKSEKTYPHKDYLDKVISEYAFLMNYSNGAESNNCEVVICVDNKYMLNGTSEITKFEATGEK